MENAGECLEVEGTVVKGIRQDVDRNSIKEIEIPEGITEIAGYAFAHCESLASVKIPVTVSSIGEFLFADCESLEIVEYGGTLAQWCALDGGGYLTSFAKSVILAGENNLDLNAQRTLKIPEGVAKIADHAFEGCESLESVEIPASVASIGIETFKRCESLARIAIPENVTSIGEWAFVGCESLEIAEYGGTLAQWCALDGGGDLTSVVKSMVLAGENNLDLKAQKTLKIPESVAEIANYAFKDCKSLESVEIPENVTNIGARAFENCESLASVRIPVNVMSIGFFAFEGCKNLEIAEYGGTLAQWCALDGGGSLTSVAKSVILAGENNLDLNAQKTLKIPEGVAKIACHTFGGCKSLESVEIPASVASIGEWAFSHCESLTSVKIPGSVSSIGAVAFSDCKSLVSINIPEGITEIENGTFAHCESLASVEIPEGVTSIEPWAFEGCESLASVKIPVSVVDIGISAFYECASLARVAIPEGITSIGDWAFEGCKSLASVEYGGTKEQWKQIPVEVRGKMGTFIIHCTDGDITQEGGCMENASECLKVEGTVVKGVEKESRDTIKRVVIPEGMTAIGEYAFMWCEKLKEITVPHSVNNIAEGAFCWCASLETVRYCGTLEQWYEIDDDSLLVAQADRVLLCDGTDIKALTELVVPEGVTRIGKGAFYGCLSLGRVVFPESLVSLPPDTFFNGSTLKAEFGGTKEQWLALGNDDFTSVECKDGVAGIKDIPPYLVICGSQMNGFKKEIPDTIVIPEGVTAINAVEPEEKKYQFKKVLTFEGVEEKNVEEKYELKEVNIPASVKCIEEGAFFYFKNIRTIRYGGTFAQWCAMDNDSCLMDTTRCDEASDGEIMDKAHMPIIIGDGTDISALTELAIPEGVTEIGRNAFYDFFDVKSIAIPESVTRIGYNALSRCGIETVRYGGTLAQWCALDGDSFFVHYAKHVFLGDGTDIKALKEIVIPEGVTKIGWGAFSGFPLLERVVLPESLVSLPRNTFFNGSTLKAEFGGTKEQWIALGNNEFASVECKDGTVGIGDVPPYFVMQGNRITDFREGVPSKLVIPEGVTSLRAVYLREYREDVSEEPDIPENKPCSITDITIPASVKYIGLCHPYFRELKTVRYGGTLAQWCDLCRRDSSIGRKAGHIFLCDGTDIKALEEIAIPEGVRTVKGNAFRGFTKLKSVTLPASVTKIGRLAFGECESLASAIIPCKVEEIDCYAFYMCAALSSVTIPSSVKKIGRDAFSHCPKLKEVRYGGTKEQWRRLMKYENFEGGGVTIRCSDGDIVCQ